MSHLRYLTANFTCLQYVSRGGETTFHTQRLMKSYPHMTISSVLFHSCTNTLLEESVSRLPFSSLAKAPMFYSPTSPPQHSTAPSRNSTNSSLQLSKSRQKSVTSPRKPTSPHWSIISTPGVAWTSCSTMPVSCTPTTPTPLTRPRRSGT